MSNVIIDDTNLVNIANAIREKNGSTDAYKPSDMSQAILDLSSGGGTEEIESLIDESGVLDSTEGTVTEKVEELIGKAEELEVFMYIKTANRLFSYAKSFPSKAVVNLPNVADLHQAFAYWNTEPIPIVEELIVNAPEASNATQIFMFNNGVKKVILTFPDEIKNIASMFSQTGKIEEVVFNFSTKNVENYNAAFGSRTLKRIIGVLDFSSATDVRYMFERDLETVTFAPNTLSISMSMGGCNKLTSESIQSIIDGLATVETQQKLTLHTDVVLKLTEEQHNQIADKNWIIG